MYAINLITIQIQQCHIQTIIKTGEINHKKANLNGMTHAIIRYFQRNKLTTEKIH